MKIILSDDDGDQLALELSVYEERVADRWVLDNLFHCEKCEKELLNSKMSNEPDTCEKCLNRENNSHMRKG